MTEQSKSTKKKKKKGSIIAKAIEKLPGLKEKRKEKLEKATREKEVVGLEFFFGSNDNFITASDDEFEGHYPGNQNNAILIPKPKSQVFHGSKE